MHQHQRWKQRVFGKRGTAPRPWAGTAARLVPIALVMLAIVACVALAPRALSSAADVPAASTPPNTDGISWIPISVGQNNDNGECSVEIDGTVEGEAATSQAEFSMVTAALTDLQPVAVNEDGISSITVSEPTGGGDSIDQPFTAQAGVDCSLVTQADGYLRKADGGSLAQAVRVTLDDYLRSEPASAILRGGAHAMPAVPLAYAGAPAWLRGAIAAIAGAAACIAVEAAVVAAMVALGVAAGPFAVLASPALAALAGCLGGAAGLAVANAVYTGQLTPATALGPIISGCVVGAAIAALSAAVIGRWLSAALAQALDVPVPLEPVPPNPVQAEEIEMEVMGSQGSSAVSPAASDTTSMADTLNEFVDEVEPH